MKQWGFAAAGRDVFGRLNVAVPQQEGVIEIIYCGANVAGEEIQGFADWRGGCSFSYCDGEMLFAGRQRSKFCVAEDDAGGKSGIGGAGFVAGVAGDNPRVRMAHYAS